MDADEIRAAVVEARRACAEAASAMGNTTNDAKLAARLTEALAKLADATESLLAEREAFAGRLRRTPARPDGGPEAVAAPTVGDNTPEAVTPSPAPDA
jgi:hypothetical protein